MDIHWLDTITPSDNTAIQGHINFLRANPDIARIVDVSISIILGMFPYDKYDRPYITHESNPDVRAMEWENKVMERWVKIASDYRSIWWFKRMLVSPGNSTGLTPEMLDGYMRLLNDAFTLRPNVLAYLCGQRNIALKKLRYEQHMKKVRAYFASKGEK